MKSSDSTNSLTRLQEQCELAKCSFCDFGEDVEAGRLLIYSKQFTGCGCEFTTHLFCWKQYLERTAGLPGSVSGSTFGKAKCPVCQQPVGALNREVPQTVRIRRSYVEDTSIRSLCRYYFCHIGIVVIFVLIMFLYFMLAR